VCHFRGTCLLVNHSVVCTCFDRFAGAYCEDDREIFHNAGDGDAEGVGTGGGWKAFSIENIVWNCVSLAIVISVFLILYCIFRKIKSSFRRRCGGDERKNCDSSTFSDEDRLEVGYDASSGRAHRRPEDDNPRANDDASHRDEERFSDEKTRFTYDQDYELKEVFLNRDDKVTI